MWVRPHGERDELRQSEKATIIWAPFPSTGQEERALHSSQQGRCSLFSAESDDSPTFHVLVVAFSERGVI